jgi:transposase
MARALNLARRQLDREQKRSVIADQLQETPERSARWIAKMLGVSRSTGERLSSDSIHPGLPRAQRR